MRRDAGLTLIELVIAMAVFAMVSVMGLQALTGTMRLSERLVAIDAGTEEIGLALALLRGDLEGVVPMLFYPPGAAPRPPVDRLPDGRIALSLAGQTTWGDSGTDRGRAEWALDPEGVLTRRAWSTLQPATEDQAGAVGTVLPGVVSLALRTFWPDVGWVDGAAPPLGAIVSAPAVAIDGDSAGPPPAAYFSGLPLAVEIALETERYGTLRVVERLR